MYEPGPSPQHSEPRPPLWWASLVVAALLAVVLVLIEVVLVGLMLASQSPQRDPHGYVMIFAMVPLLGLLPPAVFAVLGLVGLVRNRGHGYVLTAAAAIWVLVPALLFLVAGGAGGGGPVFPLLVALFGGVGAVVALLGWRASR